MFLADGTVISISLQVEFTESLTMISGLFAVIVLSAPHDGDVVIFIVCHGLWFVFVPFVCNLYIMIFTYAPMEICCSIIVPGDVLCFGSYLTSRYNICPLSLHVANTICICSPLAGHVLLSGSFWCLLPGLELLQVISLFLLSNYLTTICWW